MKKRLKIFDSAFSHEEYCGSKIGGNYSEFVVWDRSGRIEPGDIVFFTDSSLFCVDRVAQISCNKVAWLIEPYEINPQGYHYILNNEHKFDFILTYDVDFFKNNNLFTEKIIINPMWCSWVHPENHKVSEKSKLISIIASNKRGNLGHDMRHQFIDTYSSHFNLDIFGGLTSGGGYNPIAEKSEGLSDYMFSVVFENLKKEHLFTEKIIDCFLTGTIPIYWGANKITDYFNKDGIILVENFENIKDIIKDINPVFYQSRLSAVRENFEIAKQFKTVEDYFYKNFIIKKFDA